MQVRFAATVTGKNERGAFLDVTRDGQIVACVMPRRECPNASWLDGSSSEPGSKLEVTFADGRFLQLPDRKLPIVRAATRVTDWRATYERVMQIFRDGEHIEGEVTKVHPGYLFAEITFDGIRAKLDCRDFPGSGPEEQSAALKAYLEDDPNSDVDVKLLEPQWDEGNLNRPLLVRVVPRQFQAKR